MNLEGNKICLRNLEDSDRDILKDLINDEHISRNIVGWSKPISSV